MTSGVAVEDWEGVGQIATLGLQRSERNDELPVLNVLHSVIRFVRGSRLGAFELSPSGTSLSEDGRLASEERDDPIVDVEGGRWAIPHEEVYSTIRKRKLQRFLAYLATTPAPGFDGAPYISEVVARQATELLVSFVDLGISSEVAPDPDGGLTIRLEHGGRVAILFVDEGEARLMVNPLDNSRRVVKTFPLGDSLRERAGSL